MPGQNIDWGGLSWVEGQSGFKLDGTHYGDASEVSESEGVLSWAGRYSVGTPDLAQVVSSADTTSITTTGGIFSSKYSDTNYWMLVASGDAKYENRRILSTTPDFTIGWTSPLDTVPSYGDFVSVYLAQWGWHYLYPETSDFFDLTGKSIEMEVAVTSGQDSDLSYFSLFICGAGDSSEFDRTAWYRITFNPSSGAITVTKCSATGYDDSSPSTSSLYSEESSGFNGVGSYDKIKIRIIGDGNFAIYLNDTLITTITDSSSPLSADGWWGFEGYSDDDLRINDDSAFSESCNFTAKNLNFQHGPGIEESPQIRQEAQAENNEVINYFGGGGVIGKMEGLHGTTYTDGLPSSGTTSGTATSADSTSLTCSGASFYTTNNGLANLYVSITGGTGKGQIRRISSNTGTVLTISSAWTTTPDSTSTFSIGAIRLYIETPELRSPDGGSALLRRFRLDKESTTSSPADILVDSYESGMGSYDIPSSRSNRHTIEAANWADPHHWTPVTGRSRRVKISLQSHLSGEQITIYGFYIDMETGR